MQLIPLSKGAFAMVDDEDFEELSKWNWQLSSHGYAWRGAKSSNGKWNSKLYMHKFLCPAPPGMITDHKNRQSLDNRRGNLRVIDAHQSSCNRRKQSNNTSGFKGVYPLLGAGRRPPEQRRNNFSARVKVRGSVIHLGVFPTAVAAAIAYNEGAIRYYGDCAQLNPIP